MNAPSDNFHHKALHLPLQQAWPRGPHGLDVKKEPVCWLLHICQKEGTQDACPLSVSKHGLHSWIAAYLCLSAFASIHGSAPNSNSKLSKRSYLAAPRFIQHMDDKNTHLEILPARPASHPAILPLCLFCKCPFQIDISPLHTHSENERFLSDSHKKKRKKKKERFQESGLLSFMKTGYY